MKTVWLVKASGADGNHVYEDTVGRDGFCVKVISALNFHNVNESALLDALKSPLTHEGIIFTSARAVETTSLQYNKLCVNDHQAWTRKKIFAVGETTSSLVKKLLHLDAIGAHTGNGEQLAQFIIEQIPPFDKPLLFPCSNLKKDDLPLLLARNDRDFRAMTCYKTTPDLGLKENLKSLHETYGMANIIVFFSPSGVEFCIPALRSLNIQFCGVSFVAIGPSTNKALVEAGVPVAAVCAHPTPDDLLYTLQPLH